MNKKKNAKFMEVVLGNFGKRLDISVSRRISEVSSLPFSENKFTTDCLLKYGRKTSAIEL